MKLLVELPPEMLADLERRIAELETRLAGIERPAPARVYMRAKEYAGRRGVSVTTLDAWVLAGLPVEGAGRLRRFHVERCDAWVASRGAP